MRRRVLLVDNHDSYTGNLLQQVWCATGARPDLVQSDVLDVDALDGYTHVVLGPGPGTPHRAADAGRAFALLDRVRVPVLGVCFGMQAMVVALGGRIVPAPRPAHGRIEEISRGGTALFDGLPDRFEVVRYHSLVMDEPAPEGWRVTARTDDGLAMAGECAARDWYGVQFHPESIGTGHGDRIVAAFLASEGRRADAAG